MALYADATISGADASVLAASGSGQPVAPVQSVEDDQVGRPRPHYEGFMRDYPEMLKIPGIINIYEILQEEGINDQSMTRIFGSFIGIGM